MVNALQCIVCTYPARLPSGTDLLLLSWVPAVNCRWLMMVCVASCSFARASDESMTLDRESIQTTVSKSVSPTRKCVDASFVHSMSGIQTSACFDQVLNALNTHARRLWCTFTPMEVPAMVCSSVSLTHIDAALAHATVALIHSFCIELPKLVIHDVYHYT